MTKAATADDTFLTPTEQAALPVLAEEMSFQELMDAGVVEISEIDDTVQEDKENLVGKPLIIFDWQFKESALGEYVIVRAKTQTGTVVFADGSTGVRDQLAKYQTRLAKSGDKFSGLYVPRGLRSSTYMTKTDKGEDVQATTYYIDNRQQ